MAERLTDDEIRYMHARGATQVEMADAYGTSRQNISQRMRKLGLKPNPVNRTRCRAGHVYAEVGKNAFGHCQECSRIRSRTFAERKKARIESELSTLRARLAEREALLGEAMGLLGQVLAERDALRAEVERLLSK